MSWERRTSAVILAPEKRYSELVVFQEEQPLTFLLFALVLALVILGSPSVGGSA